MAATSVVMVLIPGLNERILRRVGRNRRSVAGWLRTGDLGYQADGLLFVTGPKNEIIIKGGHNLIPSALEEIVASVNGVRAGAVVAVGIRPAQRETETVCILAETRVAPGEYGALSRAIRTALKCQTVTVDRVLLTSPKSLPRTTSGKIQRLAIARILERGERFA
jgi:fatty-acyl-CoA synthase